MKLSDEFEVTLNGKTVTKHCHLKSGDIIGIGSRTIKFLQDDHTSIHLTVIKYIIVLNISGRVQLTREEKCAPFFFFLFLSMPHGKTLIFILS